MPAAPTPPDADTRTAMRRVRAVYDAAHEQLGEELREQLMTHPELGPLVRVESGIERAERMLGHEA